MPTPDVEAWAAWRPDELAARLEGWLVPWAVAAGWALDLWLGGEPREHEDLEVAIARESFPAVRAAFPELEWFGAGGLEGVEETLWPVDLAPGEVHQTWGWDAAEGCWRVDVFREPWAGDTWVCRRDAAVRLPLVNAIERTPDGIPFLRPEIVLLFKAKHVREKDVADFDRALPRLELQRRRWLAEALRVVHPGHAWIERLEA
ncbi:MAG TPA: hypothetical protein VH816_07035 [Gaiellaceae bacterium]|jgi:hypothetical protein